MPLPQGGVKILELLDTLDKLKHLKRTGWVHNQVPEPETVAAHMYRMAVLSMALLSQEAAGDQKPLDIGRCVKMALVHDIGEAIVGDITPRCGYTNEQKFALEEKAVTQISSYVPSSVGSEWMALWLEYEEESTPEAKAVKQLDKLDMIAQALTYEQQHGIDLSEFFHSTKNSFTSEPFISWAAEIRSRRAVPAPATQNNGTST